MREGKRGRGGLAVAGKQSFISGQSVKLKTLSGDIQVTWRQTSPIVCTPAHI